MFNNYLKTTVRRFNRSKSSFLINVIGLSIGMACSILIFLWVLDEMNYDRFHNDVDQIYQVMEHQNLTGNKTTSLATPGVLAPTLKEEIPEFEYVATYTWNMNLLFTKDDKAFKESGLYARPDFFHILDIKLLYGNRNELINSPKSVVISRELAKKYFGTENAVGESITINESEVHTVTGVFQKMPENSSFQFDYVLSFKDWLENNQWAAKWENSGPRTIVKLYPGANISEINTKIEDYLKKRVLDSNSELFIYPFADRYLYGQFENGQVAGGRIDYVWLFTLVAFFTLLIACINFMNLSTAKATKRAKEVGIRKSIGASKGSLIWQFIGESMVTTFFSLIISAFLVEMSLPIFNDLTDKAISLNYSEPTLLLIFIGTALSTGLIAGSYPAFYLSSFEAVKTLKGSLKISGSEAFARKGLVVFQFTLSIVLIISTIVVYQQIQFTQTKNLGYEKENLITFSVEGPVRESWDTFKEQVIDIPRVANASRSASNFLGRTSNTPDVEWPGKNQETNVLFEYVMTDYGLIETMGFEVIAGRTHSKEFGSETSRIVINQAAANAMKLEDPVGQFITFGGDEFEIIGVVSDFNFQDLRHEVNPLFFILSDFGWNAFVRVESANIQQTIAQIEDNYKKFSPNYPFNYEFMDEQYAALYKSEQRIGNLAKYFAIFAVIISCLGLFGLSAFTAEQKAKEIGIRKVLGATVKNVVLNLTKDFTKLVLIAIGIAIPVSWWMMDQWLSDFAYSSGLDWWVFVGSGLLAVSIAWFTVSWQSIKAALVNPVQTLNRE